MSVLPVGFGESGGSYQIANSLRLRASASAYLSRTFASPTTQDTFTFSAWVKRSKLSSLQNLLGVSTNTSIGFPAADTLVVTCAGSATITTSGLYRDPSAWCHVQYKQTTGAATLYFNGASVGTSATVSAVFNTAVAHQLGAANTSNYTDGYLSDIYFIDGQALTPSSFGQQDSNGVWVPKAYTGTYGTNGFHLDFSDATSLTTLGYDAAGSNDWTLNNVSLTAGVTYDHMTDTPTNNYATLNPLCTRTAPRSGNLELTDADSGDDAQSTGTQVISSGLWYWEVTRTADGNDFQSGICRAYPNLSTLSVLIGSSAYAYMLSDSGFRWENGSAASYSATFALNDILQVAFDATTRKLYYGKNGTWQAGSDPATGTSPASTVPAGEYTPCIRVIGAAGSETVAFNFGQRPFTYTPPTGFKALSTANLPAVAILDPSQHHQVITVTKSGNTNFTLNWDADVYDTYFEIKKRNATGTLDWYNIDGLRGYDKILSSNSTAAESTDANVLGVSGTTCTLKSTLSDGTYVIYAWKAGLTASRQTNTDGSITSTVSRNVTAGFAIVTATGTGANATIGHGLGDELAMIVGKDRTAASTNDWAVYHAANTAAPETDYLLLNSTAVTADDNTYWNDTAPTTSVFSVGTNNDVNQNTHTYVFYCFAEIPGYSKFGSYTGNGNADGPFVYCGFRPRYVLIKCTAAVSESWYIWDTARDTYNAVGQIVVANQTIAESTFASLDILSNGFKCRTTNSDVNSANTYIFAAFAEHPFGGSNVAPATAR